MTSRCDRCHTIAMPIISTVEIFHGTTSMVKDLCYPCTLELEALLDSFPASQIQDQLALDDDADDIEWACDDLPYEVLIDA